MSRCREKREPRWEAREGSGKRGAGARELRTEPAQRTPDFPFAPPHRTTKTTTSPPPHSRGPAAARSQDAADGKRRHSDHDDGSIGRNVGQERRRDGPVASSLIADLDHCALETVSHVWPRRRVRVKRRHGCRQPVLVCTASRGQQGRAKSNQFTHRTVFEGANNGRRALTSNVATTSRGKHFPTPVLTTMASEAAANTVVESGDQVEDGIVAEAIRLYSGGSSENVNPNRSSSRSSATAKQAASRLQSSAALEALKLDLKGHDPSKAELHVRPRVRGGAWNRSGASSLSKRKRRDGAAAVDDDPRGPLNVESSFRVIKPRVRSGPAWRKEARAEKSRPSKPQKASEDDEAVSGDLPPRLSTLDDSLFDRSSDSVVRSRVTGGIIPKAGLQSEEPSTRKKRRKNERIGPGSYKVRCWLVLFRVETHVLARTCTLTHVRTHERTNERTNKRTNAPTHCISLTQWEDSWSKVVAKNAVGVASWGPPPPRPSHGIISDDNESDTEMIGSDFLAGHSDVEEGEDYNEKQQDLSTLSLLSINSAGTMSMMSDRGSRIDEPTVGFAAGAAGAGGELTSRERRIAAFRKRERLRSELGERGREGGIHREEETDRRQRR